MGVIHTREVYQLRPYHLHCTNVCVLPANGVRAYMAVVDRSSERDKGSGLSFTHYAILLYNYTTIVV